MSSKGFRFLLIICNQDVVYFECLDACVIGTSGFNVSPEFLWLPIFKNWRNMLSVSISYGTINLLPYWSEFIPVRFSTTFLGANIRLLFFFLLQRRFSLEENQGGRVRPLMSFWGTLLVTMLFKESLNQVQFSSTEWVAGFILKKSCPSSLTRFLKFSLFTFFHREILRGGFRGSLILVINLARTMKWSLIPARGDTSEIKSGCEVSSRSNVFSAPLVQSRRVGKETFCVKWLFSNVIMECRVQLDMSEGQKWNLAIH